jgi:hypothetical protein
MKKMVIIGHSNARHCCQGMRIGLEEIRVGLDLGYYWLLVKQVVYSRIRHNTTSRILKMQVSC